MMRSAAWFRYVICTAAVLTLLLGITWYSNPEWRPTATIVSAFNKTWGLTHPSAPPSEEQTQDKEAISGSPPPSSPTTSSPTPSSPPNDDAPGVSPYFASLLTMLFEPLKVPITAPNWTDSDGTVYTIPANPVWTKPLGKRLCIIDIDTRPLDDTNDIMGNGQFNWTLYGPTSAGMMGHYLYAQIHGYDYKFVRTQNFPDRSAYWTKIPALSDTLRDYEFVISIDADAQIQHPEIPFEWLLNRWGTKKTTALTMTIDPNQPQNLDPKGRPYNNCGFVVAHNIPRTHDILKTWASCPDEPSETFSRCSRWKNPWPAEQAAFGEYVRYVYDKPDDINEVPCDEANGFPESDSDCSGRFVRHLWSAKKQTRDVINNGFMQIVMKQLHEQFISDKSIIIERPTNDFTKGTAN